MNAVLLIAAHALREARRRRVLTVVAVLTIVFGVLFAWGAAELFETVDEQPAITGELLDTRTLTGATMVGLALFGALFLGAVLVTFLTAGAVQGDAESGLLQPLLVRPVSRVQYLLGRYLAAAATGVVYVLVVYLGAVVIVGVAGDWWPSEPFGVALRLAVAIASIAALAVLGSVRLGATANGIFVLMLYGAGLVAGLMGAIGESVGSSRLERIADVASWALPFQGLYRDGLQQLVTEVGGPAGALLRLGPLGSSHDGGPLLLPWAAVHVAIVLAAAAWLLRRRDL